MSKTSSLLTTQLTLASSSPRRRQLLALLGLPFVVRPADVDEVNQVGEGPREMALRLSRLKARALRSRVAGGRIIAADTLVCLDGQVLGKPAHPAEAVRMLERLRGRSHQVFSGVTVIDAASGWERGTVAQTTVWMRDYSDAQIAAYVASGDPLDKAGGYAIQHRELSPVARVDGCYSNVMGLPLCHLHCILRAAGYAPAEPPVAACDGFHCRHCEVAGEILGRQCEPVGGEDG
jgi:MAF protein